MEITKRSSLSAFAAMVLALYSLPALADDMPEIMHEGAITYVTGGIGNEEREALESSQRNYNLRITSAEVTGAFSGDTRIIIRDHSGKELLSTDAGPIFYAKLPDGRYVVEGSNEGQNKKQNITITGSKPVFIKFGWKALSGQPRD